MTKYSSVIFDFDGTLFDTRRAIGATLHETFVRRGQPPPSTQEVDALVARGINLEDTFRALLPELAPGAELATWVAMYRSIYSSGTGIQASVPFAGSREALAALQAAGIPIVIASNKGEASVREILAHSDMARFVHLIVAARDSRPTKPDPRSFFERIAPNLGPEACSRVLVAGDTDVDIRYARSIGASVCWAAYGYGEAEVCEPLEPDMQAQSPLEIAAAAGVTTSEPRF